ncbi:MAG: cell surface protein SprA, partial [Candidatus Latescibacteria bacterium]|nr:cell surface protein SprA [Candidatus Latescibacterota bacterium]
HLVFPFLEPFGAQGFGAPDLETRVEGIYTETNRANRTEASKYFMRVRSTSQSTEYNLGFDLVESSEVVRLNNRTLERGTDYTIDYNFGRLKFIGEAENEVADPTADLDITFQNKDAFGGFGQSKSLLGVRLERAFDDQYSLLGMTLLYSNQTTPAQRVRVGQEPARTILWDANARFRLQPQRLTDLVNSIPLVNTQAPSSIDIDFEIAQSMPNPNTKNVAYIDDFEGAENSSSFQIGKLLWNRASPPTRNNNPIILPQARLTWYNPIERDRAALTQIQPNRDDITVDQNIVDILTLRFDPARTNGFPTRTRSQENSSPQQSWAGIMRYVSGLDLSRAKFLELWIRGDNGNLHIDLGEISERVKLPLDHAVHNDPNDRERFPSGFRTEDQPLGGLPTGDDVATEEEDIGLDGLTDAEEAEAFRSIFPGSAVPTDPSGDNFGDVDQNSTNIRIRYPESLNGTQANSFERNSRPDTEDLNSNGFLDQRESFMRYSVDLASHRGISSETGTYTGPSTLVPGTESDLLGGATDPPWRLLRIPLKGKDAPRTFEGGPDTTFASAIEYVRLWIEHNDTTTAEIFRFEATGSDWQEDPVLSEQLSGDFQVATIGTDNALYEPPPGLDREIDPTTGVRLSENSLALEFVDLYPGESASASRNFIQGDDYTNYGALTLFVHGGNPADPTYTTNFPDPADSLGTGPSPVQFFMRFAPINDDTLNFYEFRSRVYRGWAEDVNTVRVDLELMSQLKGQLLDLQTAGRESDTITVSLRQGDFLANFSKESNRIESDVNGRTYMVRGNPALSQIKAFTFGVRNLGDQILLGKNEIWVDELRVDEIRKKTALSALIDTRMTLADLGNLTVNLERRSGDFQDLQGNASGNTTTRLNFDSQLNIDKILPKEWNTSIPIRFSYNRFTSSPRLRPGSDIVLTPEQKASESDVRSQTRFTISLRKRPARENPSIFSRIIFDKASTSLNYSSDASTTGAITQRRKSQNQNLNGNLTYSQAWSQRPALAIFKWVPLFTPLKEAQLMYLPTSISYNARFNRGISDQTSFRAIAGDTSNAINTDTENFTLSESY